MNKKTGIIVAVCVIAVIIIGGVIWYFAANNNPVTPENAQSVSGTNQTQTAGGENAQQPQTGEVQGTVQTPGEATEKVKPTFVYFVNNKDMETEIVPKVLAELQAEYGDRVVFDIRNFDEDPSLAESFAFIKDQTPALLMHNTNNDICQMLFQNADKDDLKKAIEGAF